MEHGATAVIWSTHASLNKVSPWPKFYEVIPDLGVSGVQGKSGNGDGLCESRGYIVLNNLATGREVSRPTADQVRLIITRQAGVTGP